ncbi:glutathione S-transferase family protein [Notoacmeibacter sp. MSK16QG-6]|uniref:glutathione S-transferase family protein n=1 Tax=Notoacmeibacter sp. MSK16QG-6 TaxID=2957982 RepID=UPI00209CAEFE|nr:glutathione S-transferase family protein [Notoacmeibacter sp. MSK16QG-6]MCP1198343.1 glutathione S-transferase family protein [Notoacmeibacter sp. MSK16QG-6]
MTKLHWSPRSPYVRKVMVALHEKGLAGDVETVRTVADPFLPPVEFFTTNPLAKIPTLERAGEPPLFDSRVIMEWADMEGTAEPVLFPSNPRERLAALRYEAIGTGMMEVGVTLLIETRMRDQTQQDERVIQASVKKFEAVLDRLESEADEMSHRPFDAGHISVGVALCYYDFRFADRQWRRGRDRLAAWHAEFCKRESVKATEFSNEALPTDIPAKPAD